MRFINTFTFEPLTDDDPEFRDDPSYAILSHRWVGQEISLQTLNPAELLDNSIQTPQLNKIRGACAKARQEKPPIKWLWDDTCCIDKTNAVEEARSINSMFEWYNYAAVCYAYLHDVVWAPAGPRMFESQDPRRKQQGMPSEWFERGWTLQELIAPRLMLFFDRDWNFMGTKHELANILQTITGIHASYLTHERRIEHASLATRISWMAGRNTKEVEDIAYAMLGILGVSMTPQYGEGVRAFMRLQKLLIESTTDESIFAWATPPDGKLHCYRKFNRIPEFNAEHWGLIAPSPDCFRNSGDVVVIESKVVPRLNAGYRLTAQGLLFDMPVAPGSEAFTIFNTMRDNFIMPLNCWRYDAKGKLLTVVVRIVLTKNGFHRENCQELETKKSAKPATNRMMGIDQMITRPLVIAQPEYR